jgi:NAD(P)-dependent dehydrogenase (short-subunit alcohol dehydrogenase family)
MLLKGKTAVVLGASAEGGTGWGIAEGLAEQGARVVVASRTFKDLQRLAQRIGGLAFACDAAKPADIAALAKFVVEHYGKIDVAVNSAGLPMLGMIADATSEPLQRALDVNYLGNVHFIKEMAANMNDGGSIVIISSYSAVQPIFPHFAYACAKAATDCLVRYAALEFGPRGIRVNSLLPGPIKSHMARDLYKIPGVEEVFAREIPLGRVGLPRDYADAVIWLAGPAYVTGLNIPVNGGNQLTRFPRMDELPLGQKSYEGDYQ